MISQYLMQVDKNGKNHISCQSCVTLQQIKVFHGALFLSMCYRSFHNLFSVFYCQEHYTDICQKQRFNFSYMQDMSFQNTFPCFHTFCSSDQSLYIATPFYILNFCFSNINSIIIRPHMQVQSYLCMYACICTYVYIPYSGKVWQENIWRIYFFWVFGKKKFGKSIDQPKSWYKFEWFQFHESQLIH